MARCRALTFALPKINIEKYKKLTSVMFESYLHFLVSIVDVVLNQMKDWNEERYVTLINGKEYRFAIKYDGYCWIARGFNGTGVAKLASDAKSSETAALKLVQLIENGK